MGIYIIKLSNYIGNFKLPILYSVDIYSRTEWDIALPYMVNKRRHHYVDVINGIYYITKYLKEYNYIERHDRDLDPDNYRVETTVTPHGKIKYSILHNSDEILYFLVKKNNALSSIHIDSLEQVEALRKVVPKRPVEARLEKISTDTFGKIMDTPANEYYFKVNVVERGKYNPKTIFIRAKVFTESKWQITAENDKRTDHNYYMAALVDVADYLANENMINYKPTGFDINDYKLVINEDHDISFYYKHEPPGKCLHFRMDISNDLLSADHIIDTPVEIDCMKYLLSKNIPVLDCDITLMQHIENKVNEEMYEVMKHLVW